MCMRRRTSGSPSMSTWRQSCIQSLLAETKTNIIFSRHVICHCCVVSVAFCRRRRPPDFDGAVPLMDLPAAFDSWSRCSRVLKGWFGCFFFLLLFRPCLLCVGALCWHLVVAVVRPQLLRVLVKKKGVQPSELCLPAATLKSPIIPAVSNHHLKNTGSPISNRMQRST